MKMTTAVRTVAVFAMLAASMAVAATADVNVRREVDIPDIPGYETLALDLHLHSVFSDGSVWPTIRAGEAWLDGLDGFAMTDHLEYLPHQKDMVIDFNRSYQIAKTAADGCGVMIIPGAEITRSMPPGHFNALFLTDANLLKTDRWQDAFLAAEAQDAFIVWNHPGWKGQQPDGVSRWYPEHTWLLDNGMLDAIEIVNTDEYYADAHAWAIEHDLAIIGCSDEHSPIQYSYDTSRGQHRPMTLAFVKEPTLDGIRDALDHRRTAIWFEDMLIGGEKLIRPILDRSISLLDGEVAVTGTGRAVLNVHNSSCIPMKLALGAPTDSVAAPASLTVPPDGTVLLRLTGTSAGRAGTKKVRIPITVTNWRVAPDTGLSGELEFTVTFTPASVKTSQ